MEGTNEGFAPYAPLTRAMLVTILYRAEQPTATYASPAFADVDKNAWYADSVAWAKANGIVYGTDAVTFSPNESVSREQLLSILFRYAESKGIDISARGSLAVYDDAANISAWALDAFSWAEATNLVQGTSETTVSPKQNTSRAEAATILMRFYQNIFGETEA